MTDGIDALFLYILVAQSSTLQKRQYISFNGTHFHKPRTVEGFINNEVSLTPILSHTTGQPLFGLILSRRNIYAIDLTGSDAQSTMVLNSTHIPTIFVP